MSVIHEEKAATHTRNGGKMVKMLLAQCAICILFMNTVVSNSLMNRRFEPANTPVYSEEILLNNVRNDSW